ncbi:hypothetical protein HYFRA_00013285 [Hymenoscyphus fraxineus]|uniref:Major facilitator superfamily (MFS) profile domain-containing protein n=1 Tax=Hymenoscyphus fraxineus TaxID=746836 RepID=A0A9N9L855_9HELO|nr:hypothetical protein HYFRA_00013285 [Hymenoscyphus fraxineus]
MAQSQSSSSSASTIDETTSLLPHNDIIAKAKSGDVTETEVAPDDNNDLVNPPRATPKFGIIAVLLIGAFVSNSDSSLVLATYGTISSDFNDLESGRWLLTAAMLASCAIQPLYGKLSNIYGRKPILLLNYVLFGLGSALSGCGLSMGQIIFGRIISGTGAAGMVSLVSISISDLVPLQDVASYRSYVNVVSTTGRSLGGPIGGYIAQRFGWRWSFYFQCPIAALAFLLVAWKLKLPTHASHTEQSKMEKFRRIDFLGSICLSTTIVALLLTFDFFAKARSWSDPLPIISISVGIIMINLFIITEKYWAKEPIFPLNLLTRRDSVSCYLILSLQSCAQITLMSTIPLYFQITHRDSPGKAGTYLVSAVVGNTIGALLTGSYIKRTSKYKLPLLISALSQITAYTLLTLRWRGHTSFLESHYVFGGGFGFGTSYSATFIALAAAVTEEEFAIAGSGLYMFSSIGAVIGISVSGSIFKGVSRKGLDSALEGVEDGQKIAKRALEDIGFVNTLTDKLHRLVVEGYLGGFRAVFIFSLIMASISLVVAVSVRQYKLRR